MRETKSRERQREAIQLQCERGRLRERLSLSISHRDCDGENERVSERHNDCLECVTATERERPSVRDQRVREAAHRVRRGERKSK